MSKREPSVPGKLCELCGTSDVGRRNRFCGPQCSAIWRSRAYPELTAAKVTQMKAVPQTFSAARRRKASETWKRLNADPAFRAKADAASRARKGQPWPGERGGNGMLTVPQLRLLEALEWPQECLEHTIETAGAAGEGLPNCYKVDLADLTSKTAVEVDGRGHRAKKVQALDRKKTAALNSLGWSVFRLSNKEILADPQAAAARVRQYITSK